MTKIAKSLFLQLSDGFFMIVLHQDASSDKKHRVTQGKCQIVQSPHALFWLLWKSNKNSVINVQDDSKI